MDNSINIAKHLTSAEFYDGLLKRACFMKRYHRNDNPIILDFSDTHKIEPLAVPNLLCLGKIILGETGTKIVLRIPETSRAENLKSYMNQIGFTRLANDGIFEFESSPYSGMEGKPIDPLCGTLLFSRGLSRSEIVNGINVYVAPFSKAYLKKYEEYSEEDGDYVNKVDHFLYEMVDNCRVHGESHAFLTIHARYSNRRIYVAVSDLGMGFLKSWNQREKGENDKLAERELLDGRAPADEKEAILCGVYKRKQSKVYGLYNIIKQAYCKA